MFKSDFQVISEMHTKFQVCHTTESVTPVCYFINEILIVNIYKDIAFVMTVRVMYLFIHISKRGWYKTMLFKHQNMDCDWDTPQ